MSAASLAFLASAALAAGAANGFLGYGFSSLMVPCGLLLAPARLLNPALVLIELPLNAGAAFLHRRSFRALAPALVPFAALLLPGIFLGALLLRHLPAAPLKLVCYALLLAVALLQAFHPPRAGKGGPGGDGGFGLATGFLYGLTTLSGPVLALYAHRRGLSKADTRASLGFLRALESAVAASAFTALGLFAAPHLRLAAILLPSSLLGLWIGHGLAARVAEPRFRALALRFNLLVLATGLIRAISEAA